MEGLNCISNLSEAKKSFQSLLGFGISGYIDTFLTAAAGNIVIDFVKLDTDLRKKHPNHDSLSFNDLVVRVYGTDTLNFLNEFI